MLLGKKQFTIIRRDGDWLIIFSDEKGEKSEVAFTKAFAGEFVRWLFRMGYAHVGDMRAVGECHSLTSGNEEER